MLIIYQAKFHVVGKQKPLKGPLKQQLYTGFYLMLHVNLLVVLTVWSDTHGHVLEHTDKDEK